MIPAEFDYTAPETLDDALKALADGGEDAKLLAGGHSLLPLMKLRLAAPSLLVDLRKVPGLHGIERENGNCPLRDVNHFSEHHRSSQYQHCMQQRVYLTISPRLAGLVTW